MSKEFDKLKELFKDKKRIDYPYLLDSPMIDKYLCEGLYWEKHQKITLEDVLEYIVEWDDYFFFDGSDIKDKDALIQELLDLDFGSMTCDW